ncbi:fibroblast growth factor [Orgyia pseudotsugata single capsid nuclopolyhedrovirus]|nr:fibroblast growth factor [Orgyia pseudotsugata single capsid nuclopolyhedrovirus]
MVFTSLTTALPLLCFVLSQTTLGMPMQRDDAEFYVNASSSLPVQIVLNKKYLAGHVDGVINGSDDSTYDTVWKRYAVLSGRIVLKNVQNCLFACINDCGYVYSAKTPNAECIFEETLNAKHYSNFFRRNDNDTSPTLFLAINAKGHTRRAVKLVGEPYTKFSAVAFGVVSKWLQVEPLDLCAPMYTLKSKLYYKPRKNCDTQPKQRDFGLMSNNVPALTTSGELDNGDDDNGLLGLATAEEFVNSGAKKQNVYKVNRRPNIDVVLLPPDKLDDLYLRGHDDDTAANIQPAPPSEKETKQQIQQQQIKLQEQLQQQQQDVQQQSVDQNEKNIDSETTKNPLDVTIEVDIDYIVDNLLNKRKTFKDSVDSTSRISFVTNYSFENCKFVKN